MTVLRRLAGIGLGVTLLTTPMIASAQAEASRALDTPDDFWKVVLLTALGIGGALMVATIGYLYRQKRSLAWEFQQPDPGEHANKGQDQTQGVATERPERDAASR